MWARRRPINFNGLVRHYFLRAGANVADIQVNFVAKGDRKDQSHDIAKRMRPGLKEIGDRYGARIKVAEIPPGPPVLEHAGGRSLRPGHNPADRDRQADPRHLREDRRAWWMWTGTSRLTRKSSSSR